MPASSEIEVQAAPEDVWEALIDEERRADWLGEEGRQIDIEEVQAPNRLVWWWGGEDENSYTRVEVSIVAVPAGSRVSVSESVPRFPLPALAASFAQVCA
jgi:uncharacterized protein YndB with AHSA1/START domain